MFSVLTGPRSDGYFVWIAEHNNLGPCWCPSDACSVKDTGNFQVWKLNGVPAQLHFTHKAVAVRTRTLPLTMRCTSVTMVSQVPPRSMPPRVQRITRLFQRQQETQRSCPPLCPLRHGLYSCTSSAICIVCPWERQQPSILPTPLLHAHALIALIVVACTRKATGHFSCVIDTHRWSALPTGRCGPSHPA